MKNFPKKQTSILKFEQSSRKDKYFESSKSSLSNTGNGTLGTNQSIQF